ncbi:MAG: hypothetical protein JWN03_5124 [Nocardia sp.]|uniref:hypothetical protein n=1 Tax=Nocardia sp. TaxID=1821 RepID=UPI00262D7A4F|nr:hypothetical protein [Nocardia sp.]MCU1644849.1 hypothetical protein [Nocardia sp.]
MRRFVALPAVLIVAGILTLGITGVSAADDGGQLIIDGRLYPDPAGCYGDLVAPLAIHNDTSTYAYVYTTTDCTGPVETISPYGSTVSSDGRSVRVMS